jgi:3-hydroxy-3-methylglutaryl CoA synthase
MHKSHLNLSSYDVEYRKAMNEIYKQYQTPKIKKQYYLNDNPFHVPPHLTPAIPQAIKDSLKEKDTKIAELTDELEELKKELETMRAMMEEC